jgi:hypothetical protein
MFIFTELLPQKANFYNHARSVVLKHVQGLIHLASSNKGGAGSRGAMVTTIGLSMSVRKITSIIQPCVEILLLRKGFVWCAPRVGAFESIETAHPQGVPHGSCFGLFGSYNALLLS